MTVGFRFLSLVCLCALAAAGREPKPKELESLTDELKEFFAKFSEFEGEKAAEELLCKVTRTDRAFQEGLGNRTLVVSTEEGSRRLWTPAEEGILELLLELGRDFVDFDVHGHLEHQGSQLRVEMAKPSHVRQLASQSPTGMPEVHLTLKGPSTVESVMRSARKAKDKVVEWVSQATADMVGQAPSKQELASAQEELDSQSITLEVPEVAAIRHEGYEVSRWPKAVEVLKKRLNLSDDFEQELLLAQFRRSGSGYFQTPIEEDGKVGVRIISYRTSKVDGEMHIVYGHLSLKASGSAKAERAEGQAVVHGDDSVSWRGRSFKALPAASPRSSTAGSDMNGITVHLPPGASVVDVGDPDFDGIRQQVIAKFGWGAGVAHARVPGSRRPAADLRDSDRFSIRIAVF
ncbi:unnamed protein product [Symbiodinium natans]|uniref:Uncharacterized protein n=1 Tax=Symbiodinium natans TaxID=878477 RepID=A0A812PWD1_9DINO|nr:unnamed protein product [Symbiodinium natans]